MSERFCDCSHPDCQVYKICDTRENEVITLRQQVEQLSASNARMVDVCQAIELALQEGLPATEILDENSPVRDELREIISNTNYSAWLEADRAEVRRKALEELDEFFDDAIQSDFENGVKCLNEQAVTEFKRAYPNIWEGIMKLGKMAKEG